ALEPLACPLFRTLCRIYLDERKIKPGFQIIGKYRHLPRHIKSNRPRGHRHRTEHLVHQYRYRLITKNRTDLAQQGPGSESPYLSEYRGAPVELAQLTLRIFPQADGNICKRDKR